MRERHYFPTNIGRRRRQNCLRNVFGGNKTTFPETFSGGEDKTFLEIIFGAQEKHFVEKLYEGKTEFFEKYCR